MNLQNNQKFYFNWVLINEIGIGPAPKSEIDLITLKKEGFQSVLSLCSAEEVKFPKNIDQYFLHKSLTLPDHRSDNKIKINDLENSLDILNSLSTKRPTFVHCFAGVERSPLICINWLIKKENIPFQEALDYLMSIHPATNPLPEQLDILKNY